MNIFKDETFLEHHTLTWCIIDLNVSCFSLQTSAMNLLLYPQPLQPLQLYTSRCL